MKIASLFLLLAAAPLAAQKTGPIVIPATDTIGVQKALVLYLLAQKAYHTTGSIKAVCLSLGSVRPPRQGIQVALGSYVDPGAPLVKSLAKARVPMVSGSRCLADPAKAGTIVDSASRPKRSAMAVILSPVRFSANGQNASLLADRAFDLTTAMGFLCTMTRKGSEWTVTKCANTWMS